MMKTKILFINLSLVLFLFTGCDNQMAEDIVGNPGNVVPPPNAQVPDGYFVVNFIPSANNGQTRAAIEGPDTRVQHVRYIIYKSTGEYVKEKTILLPSANTPSWPLPAVSDTLPKGNYRAVFLGNAERTLFPYPTGNSPVNYAEVLTNYQTTYADARITLPNAEFSGNTEYYWANVSFSDSSPNPTILLQRIIGSVELKRVLVDAQGALDMLVKDIVTQIGYRDIIKTTVEGVLPKLLKDVISPLLTGQLALLASNADNLVNPLVLALVEPLTDALYDLLLKELVNQLGIALTGNADKNALIEYLGVLLNPWNNRNAASAVAFINNYPKSIDFDLNVKEYFAGEQPFKYGFNTNNLSESRYINLKNFNATYDVRRISVAGNGLIAGVIVDRVVDDFLLPGALVDINDPIRIIEPKTNRRYRANYSLVALRLKNYTQQTDREHNLTLSVKIGDIANIDNILTVVLTEALADLVSSLPILGPILIPITGLALKTLIGPIKNITVSVPINLPLLGINNLAVSGSWGPVTPF